MADEQKQPKEGYIIDYISGTQVKASPEELEATQVFSKILVEDYGYPKTQIQTRPQFHVKVRPSDTKRYCPKKCVCALTRKKRDWPLPTNPESL